jgi:hypothetical protein
MRRHYSIIMGALGCMLVLTAQAYAGWVDLGTFIGAGGGRSAQASFQRGNGLGGDLTDFMRVVLTNTGLVDARNPTDVLSALFFDMKNNGSVSSLSLSRQAAWIVSPNSITRGGTTDPGGVVGGEWAYKGGISAHGARRGISSSGLGLFGSGDRFPGHNLNGPNSPDGIGYGVTTAMDNPGNDNGGLQVPTIKHEVNFKLSGLDRFGTIGFTHVTFQYGTDLCEPFLTGCPEEPPPTVPEPATLYSLSAGLLALGLYAVRRQNRS